MFILQNYTTCISNQKPKNMPTKKHQKQDPKEVAMKQPWEPKDLVAKYKGLTLKKFRELVTLWNTKSRARIEKMLKEAGYELKPKKIKPQTK